jgi:tetratricopeptide (TPR) repeat protein
MKPVFLFLLLAVGLTDGYAQGLDNVISLYEHGKFSQAAENLGSLVRKSPEDANLRLWSGKAHLKLHRWDDAVREFQKAVALAPQNGVAHLWLARAYGRKAEHTFELFAWDPARKAGKEFETAAQLAPDNLDIRFDLLEFCIQAPGMVGGGKEKAEIQAKEIARVSPRAGYSARAEILKDAGEWDRVRQELTQATVKFPGDAEAFMDLAEFLLQRKDYEGASANSQKALALNASSRRARLGYAAVQIELGKNISEVLKSLQALVSGPLTDDDPAFEEIHYWMGRAYLAQNQKAEARQAFQASLGFDPEYARSKRALSQIK